MPDDELLERAGETASELAGAAVAAATEAARKMTDAAARADALTAKIEKSIEEKSGVPVLLWLAAAALVVAVVVLIVKSRNARADAEAH